MPPRRYEAFAEWTDIECPKCKHPFVAKDKFGLYCCMSGCNWHKNKPNKKEVDPRIVAFVQGAKWWEYHETKCTMWQTDQFLARKEAVKRLKNKTLGVIPERGDI